MIVFVKLKQSGKDVPKTVEALLKALKEAEPAHTGDMHQIRAALTDLDYDVYANDLEEQTVTPEISDIVKMEEYGRLVKLMTRLHPRAVRARAQYVKKLSVAATLQPCCSQLALLLDILFKANGNAHRELGMSEEDQVIARRIHLAQTNIMLFIESLCQSDATFKLVDALAATGFMAYLQDYLATQHCNKEAASKLKKKLAGIECTAKVTEKADL